MAKISLVGMYNYTNGDIFSGADFPTGFSKETFVNQVILEYGEMEVLYADADFMKLAISNWVNTNYWGISKAVHAISVQYDPLNNYDRTETRTRNVIEDGTNTGTVTDAGTNTGTVTDAGTSSAQSTTSGTIDRDETSGNQHKVSAMDSSTYSPANTDDGTATLDESTSGTASTQGTSGNTRTDNLASSNTRTDNLAHESEMQEEESVRAYGNIGVTTSQQMLEAELEIAKYNIYRTFAGIFASDLLIMVY